MTRITNILSSCLEYLVIRNWQQIVSGDLQSMHDPVFEQGVSRPNLCALTGAATLRALFSVAVNVYKDSVFCHCIAAGEKHIHIVRCQSGCALVV